MGVERTDEDRMVFIGSILKDLTDSLLSDEWGISEVSYNHLHSLLHQIFPPEEAKHLLLATTGIDGRVFYKS